MAISSIDDRLPRAVTPGESRGRVILGLLITLNCVIFSVGLFMPALRESLMLHSPATPTPPLATAALNWRALASYTFVHSGPSHLFFNMLFLWILGKYIVDSYGLGRLILIYLLSAVAGAIGFLISGAFFSSGECIALCGASAAILGLSGAVIASQSGRGLKLTAWIAIAVSLLGSLSISALTTHLFGFLIGYIIIARKKIIK